MRCVVDFARSKKMNYEILFIVPAKYSETEVEDINKKIPAVLEEFGASIKKIDNWGKRKLAYQIKHFRYGYYTLIIFSAKTEALEKINKKLNLNQDIIRFQIVKEIKSSRKAVTVEGDDYIVNKGDGNKEKKKTKVSSAVAIKKVTEKKKAGEEKEAASTASEKIEKKKEKDEPKKKEEKKKAGIDELDEKLDELLNEAL